MTTPIVMLALLTAPYVIVRLASLVKHRKRNDRGAAAVGLGLMFLFTTVGHFVKTEPMAQMLPEWVPARIPLVYLTGFLEFGIAIGFFVPRSRRFTGCVAVVMLVLFFPANVYAAMNHIPVGGHAWGSIYLLVRAPLQLVILLWIYWFTIRPSAST